MKGKTTIFFALGAALFARGAAPVLENDAMRILFADASRGYGVTGIVNKVAGDARFLRDTTREIDLWRNSADTETRLFLANVSDAEQTVTLANDGFAGRAVTLPPRALQALCPE